MIPTLRGREIIWRQCPTCLNGFRRRKQITKPQTYCSERCSKRAQKRRYIARKLSKELQEGFHGHI